MEPEMAPKRRDNPQDLGTSEKQNKNNNCYKNQICSCFFSQTVE